jgi:hypothetical protein
MICAQNLDSRTSDVDPTGGVQKSLNVEFNFVTIKVCIFHPNPTRSWVIVAQSGESKKNGHWSVLFSSLKSVHTFISNITLNRWQFCARPTRLSVILILTLKTCCVLWPIAVTYFGSKSTHQPLKCAQFRLGAIVAGQVGPRIQTPQGGQICKITEWRNLLFWFLFGHAGGYYSGHVCPGVKAFATTQPLRQH